MLRHPHLAVHQESLVSGPPRKKRRLLHRASGLLFTLLILAGLFLGTGSVGMAHAATSQLEDFDGIGSSATFVQHHPKVYLVFWGPKWDNDTATISTIEQTFQALAGSSYNNVLSQYTDSPLSSGDSAAPSPADYENGDYVHNDVELMTGPGAPFPRVIDTSSPPGGIDIGVETPTGVFWGAQIRNEADKEIAANRWSVNQDSQVIVFPQEGTTYNTLTNPQSWCGMHVFNTTAANHYAYALVQYGDQNPNCGTWAIDIAYTAVHEYAEAATDPVIAGTTPVAVFPIKGSGWNTQNGSATPQEIADLCESLGSYAYTPINNASATFYLPYLWSNEDNACVTSIGTEYSSPDTAYPYHGVHTVQGAILGEYVNLGGPASVIGPPISEEMPIGGGRVSYFTGGCGTNYPTGNCAAIYWSSGSGAHFVRGSEYQEYVQVNQATGPAGFPVTDDAPTGNGGSYTYFNGTCGGLSICAGIYWSSSTGSHLIHGADFGDYINNLGETNGPLAYPLTDEVPIPGVSIAGSTVQYFTANDGCGSFGSYGGDGAIYFSPGTGSNEVHGCINAFYLTYGPNNGPAGPTGILGLPVSNEEGITDSLGTNGRVSYFAGGNCHNAGPNGSNSAIYWTGSAAYEVHGCIYQFYQTFTTSSNTHTGPAGSFGFPVSSEEGWTDSLGNSGRVSYFIGGNCDNVGPNGSNSAIYWIGSAAHEVQGCIFAFYQLHGGTNGPLGYPLSNEVGVTDHYGTNGRVNYFTGNYGCTVSNTPDGSDGAIYWTGSAAYQVYGCIYATYWKSMGGPSGILGFPTSSEYTNAAGYRETDFAHGRIVWEGGPVITTY